MQRHMCDQEAADLSTARTGFLALGIDTEKRKPTTTPLDLLAAFERSRKHGHVQEQRALSSLKVRDLRALRLCDDPAERLALLSKKLELLCQHVGNFDDPVELQAKHETVYELIEFFHLPDSPIALSPTICSAVLQAFQLNALPCRSDASKVDDAQRQTLGTERWPTLGALYTLVLVVVGRHDFEAGNARRLVHSHFVEQLVERLNASDDARERRSLALLIHAVYTHYPSLRPLARNLMRTSLAALTDGVDLTTDSPQRKPPVAVPELLDLYSAIVRGADQPLRRELVRTLLRVIMPLHRLTTMSHFHAHLSACVQAFVGRDQRLARPSIQLLLLNWPYARSLDEVLLVRELGALLGALSNGDTVSFEGVGVPAFRRLMRCCESEHFLVALEALAVWQSSAVHRLVKWHSRVVLPIAFPTLYRMSRHLHWHPTVAAETYEAVKTASDANAQLFADLARRHHALLATRARAAMSRARRRRLVELHALRSISDEAKSGEMRQVWSVGEVDRLDNALELAETSVSDDMEDERKEDTTAALLFALDDFDDAESSEDDEDEADETARPEQE